MGNKVCIYVVIYVVLNTNLTWIDAVLRTQLFPELHSNCNSHDTMTLQVAPLLTIIFKINDHKIRCRPQNREKLKMWMFTNAIMT